MPDTSNSTNISVPYFDGAVLRVDYDDPAPSSDARAALEAFLSLTTERRSIDSADVYAYYRETHGFGDQGNWLDRVMGVPRCEEAIWDHVSPEIIYLKQGFEADDPWYVVVEGDCAWDNEHGFMMVWRNGTTVCKVGPCDGDLGDDEPEVTDTEIIYLGGPITPAKTED